jgi:PAS domain S-box-containing protein
MPSQSKTGAVHEALRDGERHFQLLVQAVKDYAIFMLDPQGRITTWNSGAERIKGYRGEEIIGEALLALLHRGGPTEGHAHALAPTSRGRRPF